MEGLVIHDILMMFAVLLSRNIYNEVAKCDQNEFSYFSSLFLVVVAAAVVVGRGGILFVLAAG